MSELKIEQVRSMVLGWHVKSRKSEAQIYNLPGCCRCSQGAFFLSVETTGKFSVAQNFTTLKSFGSRFRYMHVSLMEPPAILALQ